MSILDGTIRYKESLYTEFCNNIKKLNESLEIIAESMELWDVKIRNASFKVYHFYDEIKGELSFEINSDRKPSSLQLVIFDEYDEIIYVEYGMDRYPISVEMEALDYYDENLYLEMYDEKIANLDYKFNSFHLPYVALKYGVRARISCYGWGE